MRDLKASILIFVQITTLPVTVRGTGVQWGRVFTICEEKNSLWSQKILIHVNVLHLTIQREMCHHCLLQCLSLTSLQKSSSCADLGNLQQILM